MWQLGCDYWDSGIEGKSSWERCGDFMDLLGSRGVSKDPEKWGCLVICVSGCDFVIGVADDWISMILSVLLKQALRSSCELLRQKIR